MALCIGGQTLAKFSNTILNYPTNLRQEFKNWTAEMIEKLFEFDERFSYWLVENFNYLNAGSYRVLEKLDP